MFVNDSNELIRFLHTRARVITHVQPSITAR